MRWRGDQVWRIGWRQVIELRGFRRKSQFDHLVPLKSSVVVLEGVVLQIRAAMARDVPGLLEDLERYVLYLEGIAELLALVGHDRDRELDLLVGRDGRLLERLRADVGHRLVEPGGEAPEDLLYPERHREDHEVVLAHVAEELLVGLDDVPQDVG